MDTYFIANLMFLLVICIYRTRKQDGTGYYSLGFSSPVGMYRWACIYQYKRCRIINISLETKKKKKTVKDPNICMNVSKEF